jgi:hypothetical protein
LPPITQKFDNRVKGFSTRTSIFNVIVLISGAQQMQIAIMTAEQRIDGFVITVVITVIRISLVVRRHVGIKLLQCY